jgi:hypothetical protein
MSQEISELVDKCIKSRNEWYFLAAIQLAFLTPSEYIKIFGNKIPKERRAELKEECTKLGGLDEVGKKFRQLDEEYNKNLSELAEFLEEEGFEIKKLEEQLNEDQFSWVMTYIVEIKRHLKGIEV